MRRFQTDINVETDIQRSSAAAPVVPWTPLDLGAALKFWVDARDHGTARMTDDGAGLISSITDKTAGALVHTAATTARPTWSATGFNSAYPVLTFDGTANCMVATTFPNLPTGATGGEIWALINCTAAGATAGGMSIFRYGSGAATATNRGLQRNTVASTNRAQVTDGVTSGTDGGIDFSGPHIIGGAWSGTSETGRIDGRDFTAGGTIATLATTASGRSRIGANNLASAGNFWPGGICQILATTTLTTLQREQMEGWMAWSFGLASLLPVGHTYKAAAP